MHVYLLCLTQQSEPDMSCFLAAQLTGLSTGSGEQLPSRNTSPRAAPSTSSHLTANCNNKRSQGIQLPVTFCYKACRVCLPRVAKQKPMLVFSQPSKVGLCLQNFTKAPLGCVQQAQSLHMTYAVKRYLVRYAFGRFARCTSCSQHTAWC